MTVVLSLGSNLGDRLAHLSAAVAALMPYAVSSVWETAPVGGVEQDDYLNLVVLCDLRTEAAWDRAVAAETAAARSRLVRWGPRTLDVDVVLGPPPLPEHLVVPHPRAHERAFVLAPWLELDPDAILPGHGPVSALLERVGTQGVRRTDQVLGAP